MLSLAQPVTKTYAETYTIEATVKDAAGLGVTQTLTILVVGEHSLYFPAIYK